MQQYLNYLVQWIREEVKNANAKGVVFGLSGGIDSSVVSQLAQRAFPNDHLALIMPYDKNSFDYECATKLAKLKKINHKVINLNDAFNTFIHNKEITNTKLKHHDKLILANTKARFRMVTLYLFAQMNNYLVLGTDNACEQYIGYFTKYGDGGVDLMPIANLLKKDVKECAQILGIPRQIIDRKPTAGLWDEQYDEDEMGFTYDSLDNLLLGKSVSKRELIKIENLHKKTAHKRSIPPIPKPPKFKNS